jgi:hypothetical protein
MRSIQGQTRVFSPDYSITIIRAVPDLAFPGLFTFQTTQISRLLKVKKKGKGQMAESIL